jgi:histone H3/H4|tara:strand:- start:28012 stop:28455 length:444 start_codon:yes stop_codon:yes gene_type:complete
MIQQGEMTIIDTTTYRCIKIDSEGNAHLKNILHEQGRPKLIKQKYCPYILDGQVITPEKPEQKSIPRTTKINVTKLIKENTELTISNSAKYFISEWVETALSNLVSQAAQNAIRRGDKRITAAHFYWMETNTAPNGYWPENEEYMKE